MGSKAFQLTSYQVAGNDTTSTAINQHYIQHLITGVELHGACGYLTTQCRISTQQQLLTRLTTGVERTTYLCATE